MLNNDFVACIVADLNDKAIEGFEAGAAKVVFERIDATQATPAYYRFGIDTKVANSDGTVETRHVPFQNVEMEGSVLEEMCGFDMCRIAENSEPDELKIDEILIRAIPDDYLNAKYIQVKKSLLSMNGAKWPPIEYV